MFATLRFMFDNKDIHLNATSAVFITLKSTSYIDLPDNMKSMFRPVAMVMPDEIHIAEVMLFTLGFRNADVLSKKLVKLYEIANTQLSRQPHYDFGLRSIKTLLMHAATKHHSEEGASSEEILSFEEDIFVQSILEISLPKFHKEDRLIFEQIVGDVFTIRIQSSTEEDSLKKSINVAIRELGLYKWIPQIKKVNEMDNALKLHHSMILVGPTGGGKSTALQILKRSVNVKESQTIKHKAAQQLFQRAAKLTKGLVCEVVDMVSINPRSLSMNELYGEYNANTSEWKDGLLSETLRRFSESSVTKSKNKVVNMLMKTHKEDAKFHWLVFDGPIDSVWSENLNTLLDDTKVLCLTNGERIAVNENTKVIFEVNNLVHASPATISRCAVIYMDPEELSWQPTVKSWLTKIRRYNIPEGGREHLFMLFETKVPKGISYLQENLDSLMLRVPIISVVQLLVNLLESFFIYLKQENVFSKDGDDKTVGGGYPRGLEGLNTFLTKLFLFSFLWAFGGHLDCCSEELDETNEKHVPSFIGGNVNNPRQMFDDFTRQLFESEVQHQLPPSNRSLFCYYVDLRKGCFVLWNHLLMNPSIERTTKDFTHTSDTLCYSFLLKMLLSKGHPILLSGPASAGKTTLIQSMLIGSCNRMELGRENLRILQHPTQNVINNEPISFVQTKFTSLTGVHSLKQIIKDKLANSQRSVFGRTNKENVVVFIDDVNMPTTDPFDVQPAVEVIKEVLDYKGFYENGDWMSIPDVTLLTACTNHNSRPIDGKLLQKFNVLCLPHSSPQNLHRIFLTKLRKPSETQVFTMELQDCRSPIISTLIGVYHKLCNRLKPTPLKCYYVFNIKDLSKVVDGLLRADPLLIRTKESFIELFVNETTRVFSDRLVSVNDQEIFLGVLMKMMRDFLKVCMDRNEFMATHTGLFVDFVNLNYVGRDSAYKCCKDMDKLTQVIEVCHNRMKLTRTRSPQELVLSSAMVKHIAAIARVLQLPGSHMVLIGVGGTGKRTATQLACALEKFDFFQPELTRFYTITDFKEDFKKAILGAGIQSNKVVFFVNDSMILQDTFLELLCNVIDGDGLEMFLDRETIAGLASELSSHLAEHSSRDEVIKHFKNRVRANLHVVIATSPSGGAFYQRTQCFPSLVNNCVVDWYQQWSCDVLFHAAEKSLENETFPCSSQTLAKLLVFVHCKVEEMCIELQSGMGSFITPKIFLDFVKFFKALYIKKVCEWNSQQKHLECGLRQLVETDESVKKIGEELVDIGPQLHQKEIDTAALLEKLSVDQEKVNKLRDLLKKEKDVLEEEKEKIEAVAMSADQDLRNALPALETSIQALDTLNKHDVRGIRSYINPPKMVVTVLAAVCIILEMKPDWVTAKQVVTEPGFLKRLTHYDKCQMPAKVFNRLQYYTTSSHFNPSAVGKISAACKSICQWVLTLESFVRVHRQVLPQQQKCKEAQALLVEARKNLAAKDEAFAKVETKLQLLESQYQCSAEELEELRAKQRLTLLRLQRADVLTKALECEKERWMETLERLRKQEDFIVSDIIMASMFFCYLGPFPLSFRLKCSQLLKLQLNKEGLSVNDSNTFVTSMTSQVELQSWFNCSLPEDPHSTQNAVIMRTPPHWLLLIDPQQQAFHWLMNKEQSNVRILQMDCSDLMGKIESSMMLGEVVILKSNDVNLDPGLGVILKQDLNERGKIFNSRGSVIPCHEQFKLYIIVTCENPRLTSEICNKMTVVNFTVSEKGLREQLISKVAQKENPNLQDQINRNLQCSVDDRLQLIHLEEKYLNFLYDSTGNILDDGMLIETLSECWGTAQLIKQRLSEGEEDTEELLKQREVYSEIAEIGSTLYFIAASLPALDHTYQFSLSWLMGLFEKCIGLTCDGMRPGSSAKSRMEAALSFASSSSAHQRGIELTQSNLPHASAMLLCEVFYSTVSCSLHPVHHNLFSLHFSATVSKHINGEALDKLEYEFLSEESPRDRQENASTNGNSLFTWQQQEQLGVLEERFSCFKGVLDHVEEYGSWWKEFMSQPIKLFDEPNCLPTAFNPGRLATAFNPDSLTCLQRLMLCKAVRLETFVQCAQHYVLATMGEQFRASASFDLQKIYAEGDCRTPILLISPSGNDPYNSIVELVKDVRGSEFHFETVSLGQSQDLKALQITKKGYMEKGTWVLLQNCHLASSFMPKLHELITELQNVETAVNTNFRLWLTSKADESLPVPLLQDCIKVNTCPPAGVKNKLQHCFAGGVVSEGFYEDDDRERWRRLLYVTSFFHAVVTEKQRFEGQHAITNADLQVALCILKDIVSSDAPFEAHSVLIGELVYAGNATDPRTRKRLMSMFSKLHEKRFFADGLTNTIGYTRPSSTAGYHKCLHHISKLPIEDDPRLFGLDDHALHEFHVKESRILVQHLKDVRCNVTSKSSESYSLWRVHTKSSGSFEEEEVRAKVHEILQNLPADIGAFDYKSTLSDTSKRLMSRKEGSNIAEASSMKQADAIEVTFRHERHQMNRLLDVMRKTLTALLQAFNGEIVLTEGLLEMFRSLLHNKLPECWKKLSFKSNKCLSAWLHFLAQKVHFIRMWCELCTLSTQIPGVVWLPGLFNPQSFLIAVLQNHSRRTNIALDKLTYDHVITNNEWVSSEVTSDREVSVVNINLTSCLDSGIQVAGLFLHGGMWDPSLHRMEGASIRRTFPLPQVHFQPTLISSANQNETRCACPVYHVAERLKNGIPSKENYITSILLPIAEESSEEDWVLSGLSIICQTNE